MLFLKNGVRVAGLRPEILLAVVAAERIYAEMGVACVITASVDGKHSPGSLHYTGHAVDLRTRDVPSEQRAGLAARIRTCMGEDYDVLLEADHIHIEFQPKKPLSA